MTLSPDTLLERLAELSAIAGVPARYVVAFSGGVDSTVLAHVLAAARASHGIPVTAAHIDHGLHGQSHKWAERCADMAVGLGIDFESRQVTVDVSAGKGIEAAAREARYAALGALLDDNDWLISAHHLDDQAETLLFNLLRGGGPAGAAGIARARRLGDGWLVRPLLDIPRAAIVEYASAHGIGWIDDPSNEDRRFARNYLRHEVLPVLEARWPDAATRLGRSAALASEAQQLLGELAGLDLATLGERVDRLAVDRLLALSPARQRNALRAAIRILDLPMPTAAQLSHVLDDVLCARDDAQPLVCWPGAELRRHRNRLYLLPAAVSVAPGDEGQVVTGKMHSLDAGLGNLALVPNAARGLADAVIERGLELRYRHGGEEITPFGQIHTRKLKKLLQEEGVVPWMRDRIPLLYSGDDLVAVGDLWIAAAAASAPGTAVRWQDRPAIH